MAFGCNHVWSGLDHAEGDDGAGEDIAAGGDAEQRVDGGGELGLADRGEEKGGDKHGRKTDGNLHFFSNRMCR